MSAAHQYPNPKQTNLWVLATGAAVALVFGAVFIGLGSSSDPGPQLAKAPISLPDEAPVFVMKYEVTVAEWNRCHDAGGCDLQLHTRPEHVPRGTPATGVSYVDVSQYVDWINTRTVQRFRLPTVAEWKHMSKAVLPEEPDPIFTDPNLTWASSYLLEENASRALQPSGSFSVSPEGIADLDGSVWEWTQDCYNGLAGAETDRCPAYFVGGEHIAAIPYLVRDPARGGCAVGAPPAHLGLRLVTDTSAMGT